jgi:hypothetical protein
VTHSHYLLGLDWRLGKIPNLPQTMTEAGNPALRSARLSDPEETKFDYVEKYESLKKLDLELSERTDSVPDISIRRQRSWDKRQQRREVGDVEEEEGEEEEDLFAET